MRGDPSGPVLWQRRRAWRTQAGRPSAPQSGSGPLRGQPHQRRWPWQACTHPGPGLRALARPTRDTPSWPGTGHDRAPRAGQYPAGLLVVPDGALASSPKGGNSGRFAPRARVAAGSDGAGNGRRGAFRQTTRWQRTGGSALSTNSALRNSGPARHWEVIGRSCACPKCWSIRFPATVASVMTASQHEAVGPASNSSAREATTTARRDLRRVRCTAVTSVDFCKRNRAKTPWTRRRNNRIPHSDHHSTVSASCRFAWGVKETRS